MSPAVHATQIVQAAERHEPDSKVARIRNSHILLYAQKRLCVCGSHLSVIQGAGEKWSPRIPLHCLGDLADSVGGAHYHDTFFVVENVGRMW